MATKPGKPIFEPKVDLGIGEGTEITLTSSEGYAVTTTMTFATLAAEQFWQVRHELHEQKARSEQIWSNMTDKERAALASKVRKAIAVMHDHVDEWLPYGLTMDKTGQMIRVELNMMAAEIDAEVHLLDMATSFEIAETQRKTAEILGEIGTLTGKDATAVA